MTEQNGSCPPKTVLQLAMGGFVSQAVLVAARLGVADAIGDGIQPTEALATSVGARPAALRRLLCVLACHGVVEESLHGWKLTPAGQSLRAGVPGSVRDIVLFFAAPEHGAAWAALEYAVLAGRSAFGRVHGGNFWDYMATHPSFARSFDSAMDSFAKSFQADVLDAYDFSGIRTLVDVGGGQGGLLCAILARHPAMRGIVFDVPHVIDGTCRAIERAGLADRCEAVGGDFFVGVPHGADGYVLASILHDWDDDRAVAILRNVRAAAAPGARVLLAEFVERPPTEPDLARLVDLEMLVMTEGGRERTESEFADLLAAAGLRLTRVVPIPCTRAVIEAVAE